MQRVIGPLGKRLTTAAIVVIAVLSVYLWLATSPVWGLLYAATLTVALLRIRPGRRDQPDEHRGEPRRPDG
jgi:hypothetical protein